MSDQIITNAMLRAQDLARIAELEHRTLWLEERISDVSSRHIRARERIAEFEAERDALKAQSAAHLSMVALAEDFLAEIARNAPDWSPIDSPSEIICDLIGALEGFKAEISHAVIAEREACAKVCDDADKSTHPADLADAIRARGAK